jgi:hypothetical protein
VSVALFLAALLCCGVLLGTRAGSATAFPNDGQPIHLYGAVKAQVDDLRIQAGFVQAEIDSLDIELERRTEGYNQLLVQLDRINVRMTDVEKNMQQNCPSPPDATFDECETFGIVAGNEGWDIGVVGLVATKLSQRHWRTREDCHRTLDARQVKQPTR